jgi:hypothetical protein
MTVTDLQFIVALGALSLKLLAFTSGLLVGCGVVVLIQNWLALRKVNAASAPR